jgi:hypothetical protein
MPDEPARTKRFSHLLNVTLLGIDSNYDPLTLAAFQYREKNVYPHLLAKGFTVKKFQGPLARRHYIAPEARKPEVEYLTGVGHGSYNYYTGDYGNVIFEAGNYHPDEAKGKIVHFLSCQTARDLGPDFVRNGCRAYFGYDEDLTFQMADKEIFFECDAEIDKAFADGLSASQVYDRVKKLYDQRIADLRADGKLYVAATVEFDRDHLRCPSSGGATWGDPKAKLS